MVMSRRDICRKARNYIGEASRKKRVESLKRFQIRHKMAYEAAMQACRAIVKGYDARQIAIDAINLDEDRPDVQCEDKVLGVDSDDKVSGQGDTGGKAGS